MTWFDGLGYLDAGVRGIALCILGPQSSYFEEEVVVGAAVMARVNSAEPRMLRPYIVTSEVGGYFAVI